MDLSKGLTVASTPAGATGATILLIGPAIASVLRHASSTTICGDHERFFAEYLHPVCVSDANRIAQH